MNRQVLQMIRCVRDKNIRDWDSYLPHIAGAIRATVSRSTGFTPNKLMLGREVNKSADLLFGTDKANRVSKTPPEYVVHLELWRHRIKLPAKICDPACYTTNVIMISVCIKLHTILVILYMYLILVISQVWVQNFNQLLEVLILSLRYIPLFYIWCRTKSVNLLHITIGYLFVTTGLYRCGCGNSDINF